MLSTQSSWCDITHCTHPEYIVCTVSLLSGPLGQHLEVDELYFAYVLARIVVEEQIYHQVCPARRGWVIEAILNATNSHLV